MAKIIIYRATDDTLRAIRPGAGFTAIEALKDVPSGQPYVITDEANWPTTPLSEQYRQALRINPIELVNGEGPATVSPDAEILLDLKREAGRKDRTTFAKTCAQTGIITWAEAALWATGTGLPEVVTLYIASLPTTEQEEATFTILTEPFVWRKDPHVEALARLPGLNLSDGQIDALFGI